MATQLPSLPAVTLAKSNPLRVNAEPAATGGEAPKLAGAGRYIVSFSYSGPTTIVHVEQNAADGKNIFADRDLPFASLPPGSWLAPTGCKAPITTAPTARWI